MSESDIPPGIEPGDGWTCREGHRHFQCFACHQVFMSNPDFTREAALAEAEALGASPTDEEDVISMCDECQPGVVAMLREKGLIP